MRNKSKIRSIRFSPDIYDLIERQSGENFTQKFDNLVTRCFYELPAKERELQRINQEIDEQRLELQRMGAKISFFRKKLNAFQEGLSSFERILDDLSKM